MALRLILEPVAVIPCDPKYICPPPVLVMETLEGAVRSTSLSAEHRLDT